jgi:hypothetical protein
MCATNGTGRLPTHPAADAVLITTPPPDRISTGHAYFGTKKTRSSSFLSVKRQSSTDRSAMDPTRAADPLL